MNVVLSGLVGIVLVVGLPAQAAQVQAAPASSAGGQVQLDQAITRQQASVKQLQGEVSQQETRSHQADEKLKQQDQAIADLQKQLEALKATPKETGHP